MSTFKVSINPQSGNNIHNKITVKLPNGTALCTEKAIETSLGEQKHHILT